MARIDVRPDDDSKARLDRAAARVGLSLASFVLSAALERAEEVLAREARVLSNRDRDRLLALLDGKAPSPNATLKRAFKRHKALVAAADD